MSLSLGPVLRALPRRALAQDAAQLVGTPSSRSVGHLAALNLEAFTNFESNERLRHQASDQSLQLPKHQKRQSKQVPTLANSGSVPPALDSSAWQASQSNTTFSASSADIGLEYWKQLRSEWRNGLEEKAAVKVNGDQSSSVSDSILDRLVHGDQTPEDDGIDALIPVGTHGRSFKPDTKSFRVPLRKVTSFIARQYSPHRGQGPQGLHHVKHHHGSGVAELEMPNPGPGRNSHRLHEYL
eukprot:CAMPEP_0206571650 /NCGR_PEP_ID=MMETSP0325_2-20121206/27765_1 /ASSEMBLY_ACC=CAM_ASM_000347 /TAXON_ID=2866 /ORGANISM="Crypthecodinium cohnii, Strain Seligo" /LENGTH=239 /DNA_ID=CAMNT_0054075681 /DNA_START=132 /DNA_END=851 /DNA_ORIENTATION=-